MSRPRTSDIIHAKRLPSEISNPVRDRIRAHLDAGGSVDALDIERNRPATDLAFAVVGYTPKMKSIDARYRCSYCETDRKFAGGLIVLMSDERLRLIGPNCWQDHFRRDAFADERGDYNLYLRREEFMAIRADLGLEARRYLGNLRDTWAQYKTALLRADAFGSKVGKHIPRLYEQLDRARKNGGRLEIARRATKRERDIAAEANDPTNPNRRTQKFTLATIGVLDGLALLAPRLSEATMAAVFPKLEAAADNIAHVAWHDLDLQPFGAQLRSVSNAINKTVDAVALVNEVVRDARALLSRASLSTLIKWARDDDCPLAQFGDLVVDGNNLMFEGHDGSLSRVDFPNVDQLRELPESDLLVRFTKRL